MPTKTLIRRGQFFCGVGSYNSETVYDVSKPLQRSGHSLQTTALVHEAYLRLPGSFLQTPVMEAALPQARYSFAGKTISTTASSRSWAMAEWVSSGMARSTRLDRYVALKVLHAPLHAATRGSELGRELSRSYVPTRESHP